MAVIIDRQKLRVFEYFGQLCDYAGWEQEPRDFLWGFLLKEDALYREFVYYLEHHTFCGELCFHGYTLIDLYVRQMDRYNLFHDTGKNTGSCNKEDLVLRSFYTMAKFAQAPDYWEHKLSEDKGMDRLDP